ncbi:MAG: MFS transporter [Neisseriaceae bacterium]|nr:MFS transporter [Neisseriaceae bacterium]MBP6862054.1 MFS transporter [Neisseriaceae bacterium]
MATLAKHHDKKTRVKTIAGITIGNAIEFYDFAIYSVFAVLIGTLYFPGESDFIKLMLTFATFGVGFLTRPLGALVIGLYADRHGRRPAMFLTLMLMGLGTLIFVVTPTYAQIGIAAPILIVLGRLIQGFAIGGELGASTTMLMEYADDQSRGFYGSWQLFGQALSTMLGALVGLILGWLLSEAQLASWGWRFAMLLGLLVVPFALYIRRALPETRPADGHQEHSSLGVLFRGYPRELLAGVLITMGGTVANFIVLNYMMNYAISVLKLPFSSSIWAAFLAAGVQLVLIPWAGRLSDKVGRKKVVFWARVPLILLIYPLFAWISQSATVGVLLWAVLILSIFLALNSGPSVVLCAEIFPSHVRATGLSLVYSLGVMLFGGFAQMIATGLIQLTGNPNAPALYMVITGILSLIGLLLVKETAGQPLR